MNLLVFGCGYSASHFLARHAQPFAHIAATTRGSRPDSGDLVQRLVFDGRSAEPAVLAALADADALLVSVPPDETGDPVLAHFGAALRVSPKLSRIVYLSTIGVYGDHGGAWIDEATPASPQSARSITRLQAERDWQALGEASGKAVHILRLAGIYGPGQNALVNLRNGTARRIVKPGQVFNRIHVEDIARAIAACFARKAGGVWNVTDNEPAPPQDVVAYAAQLLGMVPPPELDFATTGLSPMARSFYSENKRVANRRLVETLGVTLAFPTYREGMQALAQEMNT